MSRMIVEAGILAMARGNRLTAAVAALGVVFMVIGFAYPSASMSSGYVDQSVPQIVTGYGP